MLNRSPAFGSQMVWFLSPKKKKIGGRRKGDFYAICNALGLFGGTLAEGDNCGAQPRSEVERAERAERTEAAHAERRSERSHSDMVKHLATKSTYILRCARLSAEDVKHTYK